MNLRWTQSSAAASAASAHGTSLAGAASPRLADIAPRTANRDLTLAAVFALTFAMAFGLRAPFALAPGFGLDSDAWLLAESARRIAVEGAWVPSRPPGYPLVELALAPLVRFGPAATNSLSAALAALAAALGALWLARRGVQYAWALPLAAVGLPAIALPAASTMDHTFALALLAGALVAFDARTPRRASYAAGLLLGLACAARPPLAVIVPAFLGHAFLLDGRRGLVRFTLGLVPAGFWVAASVARCTYWPRPLQAGMPAPDLTHILACAGPGALGAAGLATLVVLVVAPWSSRSPTRRSIRSVTSAPVHGDAASRRLLTRSIALAAAEFVLFPLEPNYLAPVCLLGALALGLRATPMLALAAALVVNVGGYATPTSSGITAGPWRKDDWARQTQVKQLADARRALEGSVQPGLRVVGEDAAALRYLLGDRGAPIEFELTAERGVRIEWTTAPSE